MRLVVHVTVLRCARLWVYSTKLADNISN